MNYKTLTECTLHSIEELKGLNIKLIDVRNLTSITEYMIMCSGTSNRHVKSIAQNIIENAKKSGYTVYGSEGIDTGEWALVDLGDIIIHVMQPSIREFYNLEGLWDIQQ